LLAAEELPTGTLFGLSLSADGKTAALGTNLTARSGGSDDNGRFVIKTPAPK
jgi:hypothetical protein